MRIVLGEDQTLTCEGLCTVLDLECAEFWLWSVADMACEVLRLIEACRGAWF